MFRALMKRFILALFCIVYSSAAISASAQVAPAASRRGLSIYAGAEGSAFQPDYAGNREAQTGPNRLYGVGGFIDARLSRWIEIEAEGRWLRFNEYRDIGQNTYMIGPKVPIIDFHRWTPYGKFLYGWGSGTGWLSGKTTSIAYGGGVEYQLTKRLTIRPFDIEYEHWSTTPTLSPYGASAGISYRIFGGRGQ